jgi:Na+/H+ antiporter NhaC
LNINLVLSVIAVVLLLFHWKGPNAVWGGATLGIIVGLITALVIGDWGLLALIFAICTFIGTFFEWISRLRKRQGI